MPAVFAVIASTMILHGFSLRPLGRKLKLTLSDEQALSIVGANDWSTGLAIAVHQAGAPVLLVDNSRQDLQRAEKAGVPVLRAEVLSEEGAESLEERPGDYLIAATPDAIYNGLVCAHLAPHFGRQRVYQVSPGIARLDLYRGLSRDARGKVLGEPSWNFTLLDTLIREGWKFRSVEVTPDNQESLLQESSNLLVVLVLQKGVSMTIVSAEDEALSQPEVGQCVIALVPPVHAEPEEKAG